MPMNIPDVIFAAVRYFNRKTRVALSNKPILLNYPAATVCNHKCLMCNIHQKKRPEDINAAQVAKILGDQLFTNIEALGFSGGEPFMKKDLLETVEVIFRTLPSLKYFSISTNGGLPRRMSKIVPDLRKIAKSYGKTLNISFSMDAVGDKHNIVRGAPDAWEKLLQSIQVAKNNGFTPTVLMTIHRFNWDEVFRVHAYCLDSGLIPYFGIATVIERLGNENMEPNFKMTLLQKLYVAEFLENLSASGNQKLNKRIWYKKLLRMLVYGEQRTAGCIAQKSGVYLSDKGEVSYCGVYDVPLEKAPNESYWTAFNRKDNREKIYGKMLEKHCHTCMHDYQSELTLVDAVEMLLPSKLRALCDLYAYHRIGVSRDQSGKSVLLFGCFGTETLGDKAIYGTIIDDLAAQGYAHFTILTERRYYTQRTVLELGYNLDHFTIMELGDRRQVDVALAVFCGGPVMGYAVVIGFNALATKLNKAGVPLFVRGIGWGPFRNIFYEKVGRSFLRKAEQLEVRDSASAVALGLSCHIEDPAFKWVRKIRPDSIPTGRRLGISLRNLSRATFSHGVRFDAVVCEMAKAVNRLFAENRIDDIALIPMNTHFVGGDDRIALRQLGALIEEKGKIISCDGFLGPQEAVAEIRQCSFFWGTRYHSCVFALAMGIPTIGLEYIVGGGKVKSLFADRGLSRNVIEVSVLSADRLVAMSEREFSLREDHEASYRHRRYLATPDDENP